MNEILLSIVIPVYNREDCIIYCIKSILEQELNNNIEIIVIDDGSLDNTPNIVNDISKNSNNIIGIYLNKNKGAVSARNKGIEIARGKYTLFLDSDDTLLPKALSILRNVINKNPHCAHFLFPVAYRKNKHIKRKFIINYEDWLDEKYKGDYTHVVETKILKNNLFPANYLLGEIVGWFYVYKEAPQLFCNTALINVVLGRDDSSNVKFDNLLFENKINYLIEYYVALIDIFYEDYRVFKKYTVINKLFILCLINHNKVYTKYISLVPKTSCTYWFIHLLKKFRRISRMFRFLAAIKFRKARINNE